MSADTATEKLILDYVYENEASSAMKKCAQFFERSATRSPGERPRERRWVAIRRASLITSFQV